MTLLLGIAWAIDFVPRYDENSPEAPDLASQATVAEASRTVERTPPRVPPDIRNRVELGALPDTDHPWLDEAALTLSISGDFNRRYYLVLTLIAGGEIDHWRQGPYDAPDMSVPVAIELPVDLAGKVDEAGSSYLAVQVASADFAEESIRYHEPPPATQVTVTDGRVAGIPRAQRTRSLTTSEDW